MQKPKLQEIGTWARVRCRARGYSLSIVLEEIRLDFKIGIN